MHTSDKLKKLLPLVIVLLLIGSTVYGLKHVGDSENYAPVQPIPFSHKIHAGDIWKPRSYSYKILSVVAPQETEQGRLVGWVELQVIEP